MFRCEAKIDPSHKLTGLFRLERFVKSTPRILTASMYVPYIATMVCASLGIFALRGLYYAIMEEGQVPLAYTGSAVGLVSVTGYAPDIFMGPLMGYLLDSAPGASGHRHVFSVVTLRCGRPRSYRRSHELRTFCNDYGRSNNWHKL